MAWQCPRDGSTNSGDTCKACGGPPYTHLLVLTGEFITIRVSERQRVIGAHDWPIKCKRDGISRLHARIFFNTNESHWYVANVSDRGKLAVNGKSLSSGQRMPLQHNDVLLIGEAVKLRVALEAVCK